MKNNLFLVGLMFCSMTIIGQTEKESNKESWYFKAGGSYFTQTASTEFPVVGGQLPNRDVYVGTLSNNKLASRESVWFVWEGFRTGITAGYRFNTRLVLKWVLIIILVMIKQWHKQQIDLFRMIQPQAAATYVSFTAKGQIAFDLAPALVLF
jgi:hypothetical protein